MLRPDRREMAGQLGPEYRREHRDPVLVPLSAPDDELTGGEVDVLNPKAAALEHAEPGAVEKAGHEAGCSLELIEDNANLAVGQDDGEPLRALGAHDLVEPGKIDFQHVTVQEQESTQRLVLCRSGHVAVDGQRSEEARDVRRSQLRWVALAVEENVAADPDDVGLLGASAVVAGSQRPADAIERGGLGGVGGLRLANHQRTPAGFAERIADRTARAGEKNAVVSFSLRIRRL